ncbi:MAG: hypothetical protein IT306_24820 [Chloroflexi bacterium]|nr:hypothetical protein [Chloroflexota bacterium]
MTATTTPQTPAEAQARPMTTRLQRLAVRHRARMFPAVGRRTLAALALTLGLTAGLVAGPVATFAATPSQEPMAATSIVTVPRVQDRDDYVFTLGQLVSVDDDEITIRLANGDTQTFDVDDDTDVRGQDGDDRNLDDLQVGELVVVITDDDDDDTALAIVESGAEGFRAGGPFVPPAGGEPRGQWRQAAPASLPLAPRQQPPAQQPGTQPAAGQPPGTQPAAGQPPAAPTGTMGAPGHGIEPGGGPDGQHQTAGGPPPMPR